jgi:hypothetical protein
MQDLSLVLYLNNCPNCGSSEEYFKLHAFVERHVYDIEKDIDGSNYIKDLVIEVLRIKCKNCNVTFRDLPPFLIKYKRYHADILLDSAKMYLHNPEITYRDLSKKESKPVFHEPSFQVLPNNGCNQTFIDGVEINDKTLSHTVFHKCISTLSLMLPFLYIRLKKLQCLDTFVKQYKTILFEISFLKYRNKKRHEELKNASEFLYLHDFLKPKLEYFTFTELGTQYFKRSEKIPP